MNTKIDFKKAANYLVPLVLFIVITFAFYSPMLEGKVLLSNDTRVSIASSREIAQHRAQYNEDPLWTNNMFGGMPAYLTNTRYDSNLFEKVNKILEIGDRPASLFIISMVSFWVLMLVFGVNPWLALVGAVAYGFSTNYTVLAAAGHISKIHTLAYAPFLLAGVVMTFKRNRWLGAAITGMAMSLMLLAGHPQMTYYTMIIVLVFGVVYLIDAIKNKTYIPFGINVGILIVAVALGVGTNAGRMMTTLEYMKHSTRGTTELSAEAGAAKTSVGKGLEKDYIWAWSQSTGETFTLLVPNFKGGASEPFSRESETFRVLQSGGYQADQVINQLPAYWGKKDSTSGPIYFGAIIVFAFVLGLFLVKGNEKWWLLAATILSVMLSWGKFFPLLSELFINYFPFYNRFRDATMLLVIANITMPVLAVLGLKELFAGTSARDKVQKALLYSFGITGGLCLIFAMIPGFAGSFTSANETQIPQNILDAMIDDRKSLLRADAIRSFLFIAAFSGVLYAWLNQKLKLNVVYILLPLLVLMDLWGIDKRYVNEDKFSEPTESNQPYTASAADRAINQDKSAGYRVLNLSVSPFNDASTSMYHNSIGGYHGAKMGRYQELIERCLMPEMQAMVGILQKGGSPDSAFSLTPALNMLNMKYLIANPDGAPIVNARALGNAWAVSNVQFAEHANDEISAVSKINTATTAVVHASFRDKLNGIVPGAAVQSKTQLTEYRANMLKYTVINDKAALVVFSEMWYPDGWVATIDGNPAEYIRANYVLRAMVVPAGTHEVVFKFKPQTFRKGSTISLVSSILLIGVILGLLGFEIRKNTKA